MLHLWIFISDVVVIVVYVEHFKIDLTQKEMRRNELNRLWLKHNIKKFWIWMNPVQLLVVEIYIHAKRIHTLTQKCCLKVWYLIWLKTKIYVLYIGFIYWSKNLFRRTLCYWTFYMFLICVYRKMKFLV